MSNVPDIRFKGFTDAWEQRELGEVSEIIGGGTPNTSISEYWDGDINWFSPVEIGDQIYIYESQKKITELGMKKSSAKLLPKGTILFTSRAGIGNMAILSVPSCTNQGFQSIVPNHNVLNAYFIFSLKDRFKIYGEKNGAGSTFIEVSGKVMRKMKLDLPSIEEQSLIGQHFEHLDKTITLLQRELNHKIDTKKQVVNNIFPNKNQINPNIRFQKHDKYWETVKANEIFKTVSDKGYPKLPVLSASQLSGMVLRERNGINIIHNSDNEISYKRVMPGDYVIHLRSFQGGFAYSEIEGITSPAYTVMRLRSNEHNKYFWKYYFSSFYFIKLLELVTYGIRDGKSISFSDFSTLYMKYPSKEEQDLICKLLRNFDRTIDSLQKEIELLQKMKKGFLQKLFPKGD